MSKTSSIICYAPLSNEWKWFAPQLSNANLKWYFYNNQKPTFFEKIIRWPSLTIIRTTYDAVKAAKEKKCDLFFSHDPRSSFWCSFWLERLQVSVEHIAYSFNFPELPRGLKRQLMIWAFTKINRFIVYSTFEKNLYSDYLNIPIEKIDFLSWSVDIPKVEPEEPLEKGDYICAIGGNGRDYQTLMAAMEKIPDIPLIMVVRPSNLKKLKIPSNVKTLVNIPFTHAMNILKYSRFMVLPLNSTEIPCGHVTLVAAMHLGKAFIITNSIGVSDYVVQDYNAIYCQAFDAEKLAQEIDKLWKDPQKSQILGQNSKEFAETNCQEKIALEYLRNMLIKKQLLRTF